LAVDFLLRGFFRHVLRKVPGVYPEEEIEWPEDHVGEILPLLLVDRNRDVEFNLEYHDAPPLAEIPVPEAREYEIEKTGNQRVFLYARPPA